LSSPAQGSAERNLVDFSDKTVVITGGTGSFGTTMAEHLAVSGVKEVRIFSRDEAKQDLMRQKYSGHPFRFYIGDVRDAESLERCLRGANMLFHAAALKQVPSCEFFPMEAVRTNVEGSHNVIREAHRAGLESCVALSTDKAVSPINAMGMSKSLMEKVVIAAARSGLGDTVVSVVRYGNVLMSRGSVVPLFLRQIEQGRPMTLTNPDMTRFLMPLSQAVDLVCHALGHARPGDMFIRKAPGATIATLADAVQTLVGQKAEIKVIGNRHAEKMHETLATLEELERSEDLGDYLRVPMDERDLNYEQYFTEGERFGGHEDFTSENAFRLSEQGVVDMLRTLPEFAYLTGQSQ
jgi:UDP-N-acetylglucosamine 4,6-dehydratase/5-epimerase